MKEISVVIVNWNTKKLLANCIESIVKSEPKVSYEIVVVDNASADGSFEYLESLKLKNLTIVENRKNLGFARANNQGIKVAGGKYILLLNSDTEVKKGSIDKLLEFAKAHGDAGAVVPRLVNADGTTQGSVFRLPNMLRTIRHYWFGERNLDKYSPDGTTEVEAGVMAAFLITPGALAKVKGLNEEYFMYFEDLDYCREIGRAGLKIYFYDGVEVTHLHGASGKNLADESNQWRRLIPSSKIYHGKFNHYSITGIILASQKLRGLLLPLLLTILIIPTFARLVQPGYFPMQDDLQAFRVYEMDRCFDDGQIPCRWVPDAGYQYGYPQFNFYPPAPYYVGAVLHRIGLPYIDAVKVLFIAGYIGSMLAMYFLVSTILGKFPGFIAALMYTYIPYKAVEVYVRGAMSEFWAQIFFPLIFLGIYLIIKNKSLKSFFLLSLSIAGLLTTHLLMSLIFLPFAAIWGTYWIMASLRSKAKSTKHLALDFRHLTFSLLPLAFSFLLSLGLSAFFVLPVLFEGRFVHLESVLSGYFDYRQHFVSLYKMFLSMEWGYGSSGFPNEKLNLSLGIPHWILGIVVLLVLIIIFYKKYKKLAKLSLLLLALSLGSIFMIHMKSSFIWRLIPSLWFLQFPWRFLAVSIFLLTMLSGFAVKLAKSWGYALGAVVVAASFVIYIGFFVPKAWLNITDADKFSGINWEKQLTISIFDYLPIYATLPPNHKAPELPEVLSGEVNFVDYNKGSDFQTGQLDAVTDARIRLPIFDFPGMVVLVDGEEHNFVHNECGGEEFCFGLITIDLKKGYHTLVVELTDTPVRSVGNLITLGSFVIMGSILIYRVRRRYVEKA